MTDLEEAARVAAWRACGESAAGLQLVTVARQLGLRIGPAWAAVAWLIEAGHLVVREGRLVAVGYQSAPGPDGGGAGR